MQTDSDTLALAADGGSGNTTPAGAAYERALRMVADRASRRDILSHLVMAAEAVAGPGAVGSILVLDENGLLRNGASPNLPADYLDAIDRLAPNPNLGTCAAAAATGEVVITPDFCADSKWAELRHLPLALGFVGAWSHPIKSPEGRVLGTFGTISASGASPRMRNARRCASSPAPRHWPCSTETAADRPQRRPRTPRKRHAADRAVPNRRSRAASIRGDGRG